jgi:integrase
MANTTFKLRQPSAFQPQMIYIIYRFGRNDKLAYSTNLKIAPKYWNFEKMRVRNVVEALGKDAINTRLNEFFTATETFCIETKAKGRDVTKKALKEFLDGFTGRSKTIDESTLHGFIDAFLVRNEERINPNTGKPISYKVKREHERTYYFMKEYEKARNNGKELDFEDITIDFYSDFTAYMQTLNLSINTIGHKIQTLKIWLNEATDKGINQNKQYKNQRFKVTSEHTDSVYLTVEELEQLYNTDCQSERLERVRDMFLIGAFTGLRFSDFTDITRDNIKGSTLYVEQHKTMGRVAIPLHRIVTDIWNKYGERLPKPISNQKFNTYLKEVCKLAGLDSSEQKNMTKGGLRHKQIFKKYELITSHTARRSFATNLYLSGFPAISIMQITGHKTEKAFMSYIRVTPEQHAELLRTHWIEQGQYMSVAK